MLYKTHIIGGATAATIFTLATSYTDVSLETLGAAIVTGAIGGLIPDIDHPNSKISQNLKPASTIINLLFSHRGLFHVPIFYVVIWGLLLFQITNPYWLFFTNTMFIGIMSHLLLDALNPRGIPMFFPFEQKLRRIAKIRTGSISELLIRIILIIMLGIIIIFKGMSFIC